MLDLVGEMQDINPGQETRLAGEDEQAADQVQGVEDTKEEEPWEGRFKREAPDIELKSSRRLKQRPRKNNSDMASWYGADSDGGNFLALAFSTESEEAFCMMGIARETSTGTGEPISVKKSLEGMDSERWRDSIAEESSGLWEKGTFKKGSPTSSTVPVKARLLSKIKRTADGSIK